MYLVCVIVMHLALQCFVIQRKKLEMREVNEKGNPSFFPFPVFCPLVFCCNLCDVIVLVTRVHWDYLARVLSVNCFKSKLKFLKCLQLSHTSMYVAVISRVSVFFFYSSESHPGFPQRYLWLQHLRLFINWKLVWLDCQISKRKERTAVKKP